MNIRDKLDRYAPAQGLGRISRPQGDRVSPHAECEHIVSVYPPHHRHGSTLVDSIGGRIRDASKKLVHSPPAGALDFDRIAFIDTETTGLSGGAGVCAFLIGIGYRSPEGFVVEQFLMNDFPAEPSMLRKVCELLERFDAIASYNGRTFDVPLLDARLLLNRIRKKLGEMPHLDLLHPARRIWKHRLEDCSLTSIERHVLGYTRTGDIESWLIPQTFFDYLRTRNRNLIEPILHHNRLDILSLACVADTILKALEAPSEAPLSHGPDWFGLGTLCQKHRRIEDAVSCFERAAASELPGDVQTRCLRTLSLAHKREGNWEHAVTLWNKSVAARDSSDMLFALEELAKYYEHRRRELDLARDCCRRAIALLEIRAATSGFDAAGSLEGFEYRLRRIEKKISDNA